MGVSGVALTRPQLLARFRDEASDRIDAIVSGLLAIEEGAAAPEAIRALFREAHSIKGSAGMIGLDEAYSLAHQIEDRLAEAREGAPITAEGIESLLRATDELRAAVGVGEARGPEPEAGPRAGPRSLRVDVRKLDRLLGAVGETVVHERRLDHLMREDHAPAGRRLTEDELDHGRLLLDELQESVMELRTLPLTSITAPLPRSVRDLAAASGKEIDLRIVGAETELDRAVLDQLSDAVAHLLRNAVAHGIESPEERERAGKPRRGRVELRAEQRGDRVALTVSDDGRGVGTELLARAQEQGSLLDVLAQAGVSTAETVTEVSGRGVGLDAVKRSVEELGGTAEMASEPGRGCAVTLTLPVSLTLVDALLVERAGSAFGLPLADVVEIVAVTGTMSLAGRPSLDVRGEPVPATDVVAALGGSGPDLRERTPAVVVASQHGRAALLCDRVLGDEELVVKGLGPMLSGAPGYVGSAVLGDGRVALLLDVAFLVGAAGSAIQSAGPGDESTPPKVLVVDDQFTVRELQRSILDAAGYRVATAGDGREARDRLAAEGDVDLIVTDLEMPVMDGFELLAHVREDPARASLPVVIVSARATPEDERRGLEAGADAYIRKEGFDQGALLETVARLVGR